MDDRMLERPVWSALTTVHARHSTGTERARRFQPDISPFGATGDESDESLAEIGPLVADGGRMVIAQTPDIVCPPGARMAPLMAALQMHYERTDVPPARDLTIRRLGKADAPAMVALAALTNPGPFAARTYLLGTYWGIERDGELVAMAGERLKQPGFTEVSGVCTHPGHLGRGHARDLCLTVLAGILGRGERAYLHVFANNTGAIALYEKLGFLHRRDIQVGIVEPE